ncbi:GNAT family N-acetyltransferase, partial [Enterobacter asburiae]
MYTIAPTAITDPHLAALIARLDAYQESLYPAESN